MSSGRAPSGQALVQAPSPSVSALSGFDPSRMVRLLRALAHDCENTDGWEDAAPTAHEAADCLLIAATRLAGLNEWATTNHVVEEPDTDYESGWDNGYGAARRMVAAHLRIASCDTHPKDGNSTEIEVPLVSGAVPEGQTPNA